MTNHADIDCILGPSSLIMLEFTVLDDMECTAWLKMLVLESPAFTALNDSRCLIHKLRGTLQRSVQLSWG